jgi:hypothetical protein
LFSGPRYGGLSLPDLYDDQGIGQLRLLIGHLKLNNDTGQLVRSMLSHLQLQTGSNQSIFSLNYFLYERLLEQNWLTSIWAYTTTTAITLDIENQWLPQQARVGDVMILDHAIQLNFNTQQLRQINTCRLYLQVLTLSDIATANGKYLLPNILKGQCTTDRTSTLNWPSMSRPTLWAAWKLYLNHVSSGTRLNSPLGPWITYPHQKWIWFYEPVEDIVYHQLNLHTWQKYTNITPTTVTWHRTHLYGNPSTSLPPTEAHCLPTTIIPAGDYISAHHSSFPFVTSSSRKETNSWEPNIISAPFHDTPHFFQRLLGAHPPTFTSMQPYKGQDPATLITVLQ